MDASQAPWPTSDHRARLPSLGASWKLACPHCRAQQDLSSYPEVCPACGEGLVPNLPTVRAPTIPRSSADDWNPLQLSGQGKGFGSLLGGLLVFLVFGPLGLLVYLAFFSQKNRTRADGRGSWSHSRSLRIDKAWIDITRHAGRRGLVIQYGVATFGLIQRRLELSVRVRDPSGRYLPSVLRRYRGSHNETLVRHITKPLTSQASKFPRMWIFLPTRALPIPLGSTRVPLTFEAIFSVDGKILAENLLEFSFVPAADDFNLELPVRPATEEEVLLIDAQGLQTELETTCGVCGDHLGDESTVRCSRCDTLSHRDCWDYVGGCSTYACEGRAEDARTH